MSEYKNKTAEDLRKLLSEKRKALQSFRFNISGSKTRNVKEGMNTRKDIARIMTELNAQNKKKAA